MTASRRPLALGSAVALLALGLSGCALGDTSSSPSSAASGAGAAASGAPVAYATTTQLGSVLGEVAQCRGASSATLMGPGDDPHDAAASSQQVAAMATSGLVFTNGLGLEGGLDSAVANAQRDGATVVPVAPRLDPLPFGASAHGAHAGESAAEHAGHDHGTQDPHVWMDVARMAKAAEVMGEELATKTGDQGYADCGRQVHDRLVDVDRQVREILAAVPSDRRTLVTDHDAYGYFGAAYGFEVAGVVIPGGSTDAEPSSQQLAALTAQVRDAEADAIVTSAAANHSLVDAVAREAGGLPVVQVYEGGVGPAGTPEAGYAGAMLHNAHVLADALAK